MSKEELIGGLRNALDRGENLEKAVNSMIKAGYNPQEVNEAAKLVGSRGATAIISPEKNLKKESKEPVLAAPRPEEKAVPEKKEEAKKAIQEGKEKKQASKTLILIIIILAVITLLGIAGLLLF